MTVATLLTVAALGASPATSGSKAWESDFFALSSWAEPLCESIKAETPAPKPLQCDDPLDNDPRCHLSRPLTLPCGGCGHAATLLRARLASTPSVLPFAAGVRVGWLEDDLLRPGFEPGILRPPR